MEQIDWFAHESAARQRGFVQVCGIDEAGRGPLAGPVFAAAVLLPVGVQIEGLNDSKKLSEKKREQLFDVIQETAISTSIAFATEQEIDEINILQATFLAMRRACEGLSVRPDYALIDGNRMPPLDIPGETIVKGDACSANIAARIHLGESEQGPSDAGAGQALSGVSVLPNTKGMGRSCTGSSYSNMGPCPIHRRSFLKKILGESL